MRSFLLLGGVPLMECNGISGEVVPVFSISSQLSFIFNQASFYPARNS